jgi:nicotinamide-nucleotide amidase
MSAENLIRILIEKSFTVVTAESCTGGLVAAALTEVAGSSAVFDSGFVTYSNAAKMRMLGVPADSLRQHGAVSEAVARAMAEGARRAALVDLSVAITGVAGPGGGTADKPVGLVHFAVADSQCTRHVERRFGGLSRSEIRRLSVQQALQLLLDACT